MSNLSVALPAPVLCATTARSLNFRFGRFVLRHYGVWAAFTLLLAWANCFWRLSSNGVSDLDEARYGVAASEMLRSHSVLVATYAGQPEYWNLKPPLGYWMQELAFRLLGPTVFAMRLPSALCALALVGLTLSVARRWFGRREALLAALVLTSCFGFMSYHGARSGDLDSALSLILLLAMVQTPQLAQSSSARLLWSGMLALGFLLKSFAILPFVLATVVYLLWSGDWRRIRSQQWLPALLLFGGVVVAWMLARVRHDGSAYFVSRMFREDLFWRATRVLDDETVRPWGYLAVLFERFAPWPLLLLAALSMARSTVGLQSPYMRLLLLWTLVPLLSFSLARTQHHWYLDPTYAAWSMLTAIAAMRLMRSGVSQLQVLTLGVVVLALLLCEVRVIRRIGWTDRPPPSQTFLMSLRARLPAKGRLYAYFPLSHSERFILEVVDGYRISELAATPLSSLSGPDAHAVLLLRRRQLHALGTATAAWQIVAASRDYALLQPRAQPAAALVNRRARSQL
jgi:4-amino-4-deoxy-L-arabinose transferase-like glycosyltransferase